MAAPQITDRALRYRAQKNMPEHEAVCVFCGLPAKHQTGARPVLEVGHLDGREENDSPDNLSWTCRRCNVVAGNSLRSVHMGRLTRQYNPTKSGGASNLGEWLQAVGAITPHIDRGDRGISSDMSVPDAVAMIRATPHGKRSQFSRELRSKGAGVRGGKGRYNPWPFTSSATSARMTTPARGGILEHSGSRPRPSKAGGKVGSHRGYSIHRDADGEFYSSLDPSSRFQTKAAAEKHIDWFIKGRGNPSAFDKCVASVSAKGSADDPRAVCAAAGRKKYGQREMTRRAVAGKRKAGRRNPPYGFGSPDIRPSVMTRLNDKLDRLNEQIAATTAPKKLAGLLKRRDALTRGVAKEFRGNPAAGAVDLYEEFHGHAPDETVEVSKKVHFHKHLAGLGQLRGLEVKDKDGNVHNVTGFRGALLCSNEKGNQLYIEGGDQSVNLEDFGISEPHEKEILGKVLEVAYFTNKTHLGDEGGEATYVHQFATTNENGKHVKADGARCPVLVYLVRDEALEFVGGSYIIRAEGIDR